MRKRPFRLFMPVLAAALIAGCGSDDTTEPEPPTVTPPPDLTGSYTLVSLSSPLTGGLTVAPPLVSGMFTLTQTSVSGDEARGNLSLSVTYPDGTGGTTTLTDEGTFVIRTDGSWEQTGAVQQAVGNYSVAGAVLTVSVTEPAAASGTTVWQRQ